MRIIGWLGAKSWTLLCTSIAISCFAVRSSSTNASTFSFYANPIDGSANADGTPPTAASGTATFQLDDVAKTLQYDVTYSGLVDGTGSPSNEEQVVFSDPNNGSTIFLDQSEHMPTDEISGTVGLTTAQIQDLLAGGLNSTITVYSSDSTSYPSGEISGIIQSVPEPASWMLAVMSIGGLGFFRRRQK